MIESMHIGGGIKRKKPLKSCRLRGFSAVVEMPGVEPGSEWTSKSGVYMCRQSIESRSCRMPIAEAGHEHRLIKVQHRSSSRNQRCLSHLSRCLGERRWAGASRRQMAALKRPSRTSNRSQLHVSWRYLRACQAARHAACCTNPPVEAVSSPVL